MLNDLRFAIRMLLKNPGFTAVAVLTVAVCIGANLSIFAVVDSVLLRSLPFPEPDRLVTLFNTYPKAGVQRAAASLANYYERRGNVPAFSHISIIREDRAIVGETGSSEQVEIARVSPEFFSTLGIGPIMGRAFTDEEMTYQTDGVGILTDTYWRQHYNADLHILGRQVRVDGLQKTIVGVLPPGFRFLSSKAQLYLPQSSDPGAREAKQRHSNIDYVMIGRLGRQTSIAEAQSQIDADNAARAAEIPNAKMIADAGFRTIVAPLRADHVKAVRPTLLLMQTGVFLLLLIGGVNLTNLLLIRANGRARELAIRQSLGASRWHVVRQLMTETVLLMLTGGLLGLAVAAGGIRLLTTLGVQQLPLGAEVAFDGRLALLAIMGAVVLGVLVALPIVWFNLHGHPADALQSETRGGTASHAAQSLRHGFIVAQITLAFVLLAGAGLLGLSLKHAMAVSPGFRPDHLLTGQIALPWKNYPDWPSRLALIERLLESVKRQPGVLAAGVINRIPFSGEDDKSAITVKGHVLQPGETLRAHYNHGVSGDIFAALGIPLREGRFLDNGDSNNRVCVVDEDFARRYWPQGGAIGHRLFVGKNEAPDSEAFTIVGVVGPIKQTELTEGQAQGTVYLPYKFRTVANMFAVVRTSQPPGRFGPAFREIIRAIDPDLPVSDLRSMEIRIADSLVIRRSPALLAVIFAGVALLLAAIGTYGVLAYAVSQRRREIGVRMALGALPGQIGRQFLSIGLRLLMVGMVLGIIGAWLAGRAMQSVLFEAPTLPVATLAGTGLMMTLVSMAACWLPARRAARVDPMEALRHE
jgi:predicted permease